jgi:hypothetical protein
VHTGNDLLFMYYKQLTVPYTVLATTLIAAMTV